MGKISSSTVVFATATAKFEKSRARPGNEWPLTTTRLNLTLDLSNLISWNRLSRENAPTRPETVTTCPALPIYNQFAPESMLPILPGAIFKKMAKQAHQHIHSTVLTHYTRVQKVYTRESIPRGDASVTRAWHYFHTLTLRTIFTEIDWRCLVIIAIKIYFNCNYIF